jgi:uncharacterized membrane protein
MTRWNTKWHRHPGVRSGGQLKLGERAADHARNGMGSWAFIWIQTILVGTWVLLNIIGIIHHWDAYPFILLNLLFSTQAAYAAPLILLSQKRADQVASEVATHTLENTELLRDLMQQNTDLTEEVHRLVRDQRDHRRH